MVEVMVVEPDTGICMQCKTTKKRFDKLGIYYTVAKASEQTELIKELNVAQAPLVVVKLDGVLERYWTGFNPDKIKGLNLFFEGVAA